MKPEIDKLLRGNDSTQMSVVVLCRLDVGDRTDLSPYVFGRYLHSIEEWNLDGISGTKGAMRVREWWYLPEEGSGNDT